MSIVPADDLPGAGATGGNLVPDDDLPGYKPPKAEKAPERTWGEAAADTALGVGKGLIGVAKLVPMAVGAADTVISKAFGLGEPASGGALANPVTQGLESAEQYLQGKKSEAIQAKEAQAQAQAEKTGEEYKDTAVIGGVPVGRIAAEFASRFASALTDPAMLVQGISENVATILPAGAAGRAAQVGAEVVLPKVARNLTEEAVSKAARTAGVAGGISTGAVQQGADVASEAYDKVMQLPDDVWQKNAQFNELVGQIGPEKAKQRIAGELATEAGVKAGLESLVVNAAGARFGGATLESIFLKPAAGAGTTAGKAAAGGAAKGFVRGGVGEMVTEAPEEAYGALAANQAAAQVDPNTDIFKGVGAAGGIGAATAFGMGSVVGARQGAAEGLISRQRAQAEEALRAARDATGAATAADIMAGDLDNMLRQTAEGELSQAVGAYLTPDGRIVTPMAPAAAQPAPARPAMAELQQRIDREAELRQQAAQATGDFERRMALEQIRDTQPAPRERTADQFADLTPMDVRQAQNRLTVLRDQTAQQGGNALELVIAPHPSQPGKLAIARQQTPSLDLQAPAPTVTPQEAQFRIETAALTGKVDQAKQEDRDSRQVVIDRALRSVEERGGVASPAEARIFQEAGLGKPYDRIDESLGQNLSTDEKLTQATGIPLVGTPREAGSESQRLASLEQANAEGMAELTARTESNRAQRERETQAAVEQTSQAPAVPDVGPVLSALATPGAQRTAEQNLAIRQAEQRMSGADFSILQRAATAPFRLSQEERLRLRELRNPSAPAQSVVSVQQTSENTDLLGERVRRALETPSNGEIVTGDIKMSTTRGVPGETVTVTDSGTEHQLTVTDGLAKTPGLTAAIRQFARIFGKRVVFYNSDTLKADGFVRGGNNRDIFINANSQMSPLAVFGHELMHLLKRDNPVAYRAVAAVVARRMDAETRAQFRADYGKGANLEELSSDLMGNAFQDEQFLTDVFEEIAAQAPAGQAQGIISRLAAAINKAIKQALAVIRQLPKDAQGFKADELVKNLEDVRAALKNALVAYAQQQRQPAMRQEMEQAQAEAQTNLAAPAETDEATLSAARRGGVAEEVNGFKIRTQKDGTLGVAGDVEQIRALLPDDVKGRAVPGGMVFTTSDAPRVRAALEGRKLAYSRAGQVIDRLPMKNGKYVGAPEKFNTPGKIPTLRKWLRQLADEGAAGRYWYENSSREVLQMVGGNVQEARKFVALLAIYSPQAKVDSNSTFALRAWAQYKAGQPISVKTGVMDRKAQAALDDVDAFWSGEKTGNFFFNLLREIDPSTAGKQGATIDMWMMRAGQYDNDAPTATQYAFMENETNRLAQELGWEPQQVQAAIWVAMKARMENAGVKKRTEASSEKKGWIRYDYPIKNGRPVKTRVILNAKAHRDNWLKHSFAHDPTKDDTQQAKFDFSDGLRRHIGQLSWEARPGRSTNVLPGVNDAPYDQQVEFQQAVQKALLDDNGIDLLAYKVGLLVDGPDILAPGVWQGEIAAGMQKLIGMAPGKGSASAIDPAQKQAVELYASVLGLLLRQEGVGYHRPFYNAAKSANNGVNLDIGRTLSPAEAQSLWAALDERMKAAGIPDWEGGAGMISSPTGMRVVNFGAVEDNKVFRELVEDAASTLTLDEITTDYFVSDGDLVMNDWKANPNGEDYQARIRAAGSPDLLEWARDVLAPRVQSVFDEFSSRYGWGDPGSIPRIEVGTAAPESAGQEVKLSRTRAEQAENEYTRVYEKYVGTPEWLKAPNGKDTNLTERQWVQVRTPSFKAWFGDWEKHARAENPVGSLWSDDKVSKVVDANGEPLVVYHGTDAGGFTSFNEPGGTKRGDLGIFTTPNLAMALTYKRRGRGGEIQLPVAKSAKDMLDRGYRVDETSNGMFEIVNPDGIAEWAYETRAEAEASLLRDFAREPLEGGDTSGYYASFMNLRNPQESDFEGAMWSGERPEQFVAMDADGEQQYDDSGKGYFTEDEARGFAEKMLEEKGTPVTIEPAPEHYETTDSVVREARSSRNDGAIIRNVIDDGGGYSSYASEPTDVFVAFKPNQLKSATQNTGEFGTDTNDLRFSPARVNTPEFKRWFGDSQVVDKAGKPLVMYHITAADFDAFDTTRRAIGGEGSWFSSTPPKGYGDDGENIMPVYLSLQNPKIIDKMRDSDDVLKEQFIKQGYDGVIMMLNGKISTVVAFDPTQIKSAIGNNGAFDAGNPDITQSRQRIVGDSKRAYTPEQQAYFERVGRTVTTPTIKERVQELRKDLGKKMAQGLADQFRPIKDLSKDAYMLARLSKGAAGAFEALLHHGKLSITGDKVYDADMSGGFIERVGVPLHGELEDFLWWVAANRAERLTKEDRENLFTADDIAAGKSLDNGTTDWDYTLQHATQGKPAGTVTRDRTLIYRDALKTFDEFNKNALDMAEQSGLIDAESRPFWEHEFYVPFYRVSDAENGGVMGAKVKSGLVRQEAFKRLKGGSQKLNSDLLANTLSNWGHLIDASAKNRAALETLEAARKLGIAIEADEKTVRQMGKSIGKRDGVVSVMDQGKERFYLVDDPMLLTAITSLDYAGLRGPIMDAMSTMKHWLTVGVTASPAFKIRNLVRDSVQAVATAPLSYNIAKNLKEGFQASDRGSQTYVSALASGGLIRFGTMLEGSQAKRTRQLIKMGVKDSTILDSESKVQAMYDKYLEPAIMAYNELGNRGEEINRSALFKQLRDQGMSQGEAALMARDLMDFSMQGSWASIRFLTQVVPFMNARLQGLYKLGRASAEDKARFGAVLGAVAVASIGLMLAYQDDDDWKKREDWDRNNNWWFKIGGVAFRIPKPFEIGSMATLAERGLEYFISPEMTGKRLYKNYKDIFLDSLSMNPTPQLVKPIVDLYANKDSFTGRPIETMGMERLKPQYRYTQGTSMAARGLSTATGGLLSPVQYDHLIRGYFSWLGSMAVTASDAVLRPATGQPTRPAPDYWRVATGGILAEVDGASSRYVSQMYDQAKELEQAMGTYRMLMKTGRVEEAREFYRDNKEAINRYGAVEKVKAAETRYNEMIRMIERSSMDPEVKKERIRELQARKDRVARVAAPGAR